MCARCPSYTPVIFEHPEYGTLVVMSMVDVDDEITDDIEMAMQVMCPTPDGRGWLSVPPCVLAQGTLMRVANLH